MASGNRSRSRATCSIPLRKGTTNALPKTSRGIRKSASSKDVDLTATTRMSTGPSNLSVARIGTVKEPKRPLSTFSPSTESRFAAEVDAIHVIGDPVRARSAAIRPPMLPGPSTAIRSIFIKGHPEFPDSTTRTISIWRLTCRKLRPIHSPEIAFFSYYFSNGNGQHNIRVNSLCSGITRTPLLQAEVDNSLDPARSAAEHVKWAPIMRVADPREIA